MPTDVEAPAPPKGEAAWTQGDLKQNPHVAADKAQRVRSMFAAIAPSYDLNNRLHSLWRDQAWRRAAVKMADLKATDRVVDVACGTGDLTLAFVDALAGREDADRLAARVIGIDFTFEMLPIALAKWRNHPLVTEHAGEPFQPAHIGGAVEFLNGDAMALPLPDACCDVVSIAFGIRNVADPAKAMREFYRVLRPGGRLVVLEFSQPRNRLLRWLNNLYCGRVMPVTATLIARDRSGAYRYLPRSVETFATREQMAGMMQAAGFREVKQRPLTLGIAVCYRGLKSG